MPDNKKQPSKNLAKDKSTSKGKPRIDKLAQDIGRRIYAARDGLNLPQQAIHVSTQMIDADGIGVSRAALSLYERGINKPGAREITLLCEVLKVSPNWLLYGSESPAKALQPTTIFLAGDDLAIATRLAFAMLALNQSDRDSLANLVFSILTSKLGDMGLSSLMSMANMMRNGINKEMLEIVGKDSEHLLMPELIERFIEVMTKDGKGNYGTLRRNLTEDEMHEGTEYPPPRNLK
jgi:transcriptional regulator with XRE-family HTH domain